MRKEIMRVFSEGLAATLKSGKWGFIDRYAKDYFPEQIV